MPTKGEAEALFYGRTADYIHFRANAGGLPTLKERLCFPRAWASVTESGGAIRGFLLASQPQAPTAAFFLSIDGEKGLVGKRHESALTPPS